MEFSLTVLILAIVLNLLAHIFLMRFFQWYSHSSLNSSGKPLKTKIISYVLLVPPLALVTAVLLVGIGLILQLFSKRKK